VEEMETRRVAEERRAEDEARMLAALKEEAAYKAQFASDKPYISHYQWQLGKESHTPVDPSNNNVY
jgi:hypothetical protein